jgi:hypothetical protein
LIIIDHAFILTDKFSGGQDKKKNQPLSRQSITAPTKEIHSKPLTNTAKSFFSRLSVDFFPGGLGISI